MTQSGRMEQVAWSEQNAWQRFCSFIDYSAPQFANIQRRLLCDQFRLLSTSAAGQRIFGGRQPSTIDEFRRTVPLTTYDDYAWLSHPGATRSLPDGDYTWTQTFYGAGKEKWIPYSRRGLHCLMDHTMASLLLASSRHHGDVRLSPGDRVLYNVPPRPFLAGVAIFGALKRFGLEGVLDPVRSEEMEFTERVKAGFEESLRSRVDVIISMTSVLLKVGERFEKDMPTDTGAPEREPLKKNGRAVGRFARAKVKSAFGRRPVRPYDLWRPKAIVGWGLDTRFFSDRVAQYWGKAPFEVHASTEGGVMGLQVRADGGMSLIPEANFYEFIPESELESARIDPSYIPDTVLFDEVEAGGTYELVITNFYGMPLTRYRSGHLVRFLHTAANYGLEYEFIGRSDERIDIAGFTRLDESTIWKAMAHANLQFRDWTMRRELSDGHPVLHLYGEATQPHNASEVTARLHNSLRNVDPLYTDLDIMLGIRPLKVTLLEPGAFDRYYYGRLRDGAPLLDRRPPRMNSGDSVIERLLSPAKEALAGTA